jgi:hypothetical protein
MCLFASSSRRAVCLTVLIAATAGAQGPARLDWRRIGSTVFEAGLAGAATGRMDRVWYSGDGTRLHAKAGERTYATADFETWERVQQVQSPTPERIQTAATMPAPGAEVRASRNFPGLLYGF